MNSRTGPFDIGLQLERTALAWRRTALALSVAALASVKVLFGVLGYSAVVVCVAGLCLALGLGILSGRRYRIAHLQLTQLRPDQRRLPGAATLALCTAITTCAGLLALTYLVFSAAT